jgi:hypothetical protein
MVNVIRSICSTLTGQEVDEISGVAVGKFVEHARQGSKKALNVWLQNHLYNPYPTTDEKGVLMQQTGLSKKRVETWFKVARKKKGIQRKQQEGWTAGGVAPTAPSDSTITAAAVKTSNGSKLGITISQMKDLTLRVTTISHDSLYSGTELMEGMKIESINGNSFTTIEQCYDFLKTVVGRVVIEAYSTVAPPPVTS